MIDPNGYSAQLIKVLVVSDAADTAKLLAMSLKGEPGLLAKTAAPGRDSIEAGIKAHEPDVLVLAETRKGMVDHLDWVDREYPALPAVAIVPEGAFDLAQQCTLAGARAVLTDSFDRAQLATAIRRIHEREHWRRKLPTAAETRWPGSVIAVHGGKGGVGATTIACNLAAAFQRVTGKKVAWVDGDVLSGATAVLLDLAPIRTVTDLVEEVDRHAAARPDAVRDVADLVTDLNRLDAEAVRQVMVRHRSGVDVLLAPEQLQDAEALAGEHMQKALAARTEQYEIVVVDTSSNLTPVTLAALDAADKIVMLVTPELVPLRNASRFLQLCGRMGFSPDKVELAINRADSKSEINASVMEHLLRQSISVSIPSDGETLVKCLNSGELLVLTQPDHAISRAVTQLASRLATSLGLGQRSGAEDEGEGTRSWRFSVGAMFSALRRRHTSPAQRALARAA